MRDKLSPPIKEQPITEILKTLNEALSTLQFLWSASKPDMEKTNWQDYFNIPANTIQMLQEKIRHFEAVDKGGEEEKR